MSEEKKVVEREIPENLKEKISAKETERRTLVQEFVRVSIERAGLVKREQELLVKMENNAQATKDSIKNAYSKMRLEKEKGYTWSYKGTGVFIGIAIPEKPKAV